LGVLIGDRLDPGILGMDSRPAEIEIPLVWGPLNFGANTLVRSGSQEFILYSSGLATSALRPILSKIRLETCHSERKGN